MHDRLTLEAKQCYRGGWAELKTEQQGKSIQHKSKNELRNKNEPSNRDYVTSINGEEQKTEHAVKTKA